MEIEISCCVPWSTWFSRKLLCYAPWSARLPGWCKDCNKCKSYWLHTATRQSSDWCSCTQVLQTVGETWCARVWPWYFLIFWCAPQNLSTIGNAWRYSWTDRLEADMLQHPKGKILFLRDAALHFLELPVEMKVTNFSNNCFKSYVTRMCCHSLEQMP